jgi:hypothetical protein
MRRALEYIAKKKELVYHWPFFVHLRDQTVPSVERLAFVPAGAPFIMAFADLNKYVLNVPETKDPLQELINVHSEEDATHFRLYLKDLKTLGYDTPVNFSDTLKFLWSDERKHCRQTCYLLTAMLASASSTLRLVVVEAIETAGAAGFEVFSELAVEYHAATGKELVFFGPFHKKLETGHTMGTDDIEEKLHSLVLSDEESARARTLADDVFNIFGVMMQELFDYVRKPPAKRTGPYRTTGQV